MDAAKARPLDASSVDSGQNQENEEMLYNRRPTSSSSSSRASYHPEGQEVHLNCHSCGATLAKTRAVISVDELQAEGVALEYEQEQGRDVEICLTDVHVYCLPVKTFYDPDEKCKRDIVCVKENCNVYKEKETRTKLMWFQHYVRSKCYCCKCKTQVGSFYKPKDESSNLPTFYGLMLEKLDGKHQKELYLKCRRCQHRVSWRNSIVNLRDHVSIGSGFHGWEDIHLFEERVHTQVHSFKDQTDDYHVFLTVEDADCLKKNKVKSDWFVGLTATECRCPRDWCQRLVGWRFQNVDRHFYGLLVKELHGPHLKGWLWCKSCTNYLFQLEDIVPKDPVSSKIVYEESAIVGRVFGVRVPLLKDEHGTLRKILTVKGRNLVGNRGDPLKAADGWFKDYIEFCPVYCSNCQETIGREYKSTKKDGDKFAVVFWEKIGGQFTIPTGLRSPPYSHVSDRTAIVVGNTYESDPDTRNKLMCCANDADAMERNLKSLRLPFEVRKLNNATKDQIISALENIPTKEDQVVLFYFSGHGKAEKGFHFIVPDSDDRRHWEEATPTSSYINIRQIETLMMKTGARVKISIIDACRGTGQFHDRVSEDFRKAVEDLSLGNLDDDDVFEDAPESSPIPEMSSNACPPCAAGSVNPSGTPIAETGARGTQVEDGDDEEENSTQSTFGSRAATPSVEPSSEQDGRDFRRLNESHQGYGFVKMYSCADDTLSSAGDRTSLSYFTKHLVSEMTKELSIYRLFQHVNTLMKSDAGRLKQVPRVHSTLTEPFRFQTRDLPDFSHLPANRD
ncbi:uncharacterized protein LOC106151618 isoform X2 [Lingula anatina]|uniref:Uncharacterized protein LOC106151618 isoform X2 n=1 Tax=Lingula anatina TaxID=7574 RepID=A0A1S3H4N1_LINAN|nr:uncharacterized protein LOC106151618 isoform X2 [Lingula anatina]|eukprot:XP_013380426.1 uncharacterized protein LOC106151618 isoform X2 [Lingula anatina]